jgi:hypothetical protein
VAGRAEDDVGDRRRDRAAWGGHLRHARAGKAGKVGALTGGPWL